MIHSISITNNLSKPILYQATASASVKPTLAPLSSPPKENGEEKETAEKEGNAGLGFPLPPPLPPFPLPPPVVAPLPSPFSLSPADETTR